MNPPVEAPKINGGEAGDVQLKMRQRVFQLVAAAADKFFRRVHGEFVGGPDAVAGFARGLAVDADLAGQHEPFGLLAAVAKAGFNEGLIKSGHPAKLPENRPFDKTRRQEVLRPIKSSNELQRKNRHHS